MKRGGPLKRRTPLRSTGRKATPRRANGLPADVRAEVDARDGGRCQFWRFVAWTGGGCWGEPHRHHVWRRSQGGPDVADNIVTLCAAHHRWVHDHVTESLRVGLLRTRPTD